MGWAPVVKYSAVALVLGVAFYIVGVLVTQHAGDRSTTDDVSPRVSELLERLEDPEPGVRGSAIAQLRYEGRRGAAVVEGLADALEDNSASNRTSAVLALGSMGPEASAAVPAVLRVATSDPDQTARFVAIGSLPHIGADPEVLAAKLGPMAEGADGVLAVAAHGALAQVATDPQPHVSYLVGVLQDASAAEAVRWPAAEELGNLGGRAADAVPVLIDVLDDPSAWVRLGAANALGRIGAKPELAVPALTRVARGPANPEEPFDVRPAAVWAPGQFASVSEGARLELRDMAETGGVLVQTAAAAALERVSGPPGQRQVREPDAGDGSARGRPRRTTLPDTEEQG